MYAGAEEAVTLSSRTLLPCPRAGKLTLGPFLSVTLTRIFLQGRQCYPCFPEEEMMSQGGSSPCVDVIQPASGRTEI